jgi:hypothetical protein
VDLAAGQLERLPGHPERPGLAGAGPADDDGHAGAALGEIADHSGLVLADGGVAVEDLADQLRAHHRAVLLGALGGGVDELSLQCQQLRRREPLHAQPAIMGDPDRPLGQEPVGGRLRLGERVAG